MTEDPQQVKVTCGTAKWTTALKKHNRRGRKGPRTKVLHKPVNCHVNECNRKTHQLVKAAPDILLSPSLVQRNKSWFESTCSSAGADELSLHRGLCSRWFLLKSHTRGWKDKERPPLSTNTGWMLLRCEPHYSHVEWKPRELPGGTSPRREVKVNRKQTAAHAEKRK